MGLQPASRTGIRVSATPLAYGLAPVAVGVALLFAQLATYVLPHANLSLVFLTAVLIMASRTGLGPGLLTGLLSFLAYNYFFIGPQFTFRVDDDGDIATLLFFLLMAAVTGNLAAGMRREMEKNQASIERLSSLHEFGQRMLSAVDEAQVVSLLRAQLRTALAVPVEVLTPGASGALTAPPQGAAEDLDPALADRAWSSTSSDPLEAGGWAFYRLRSPQGPLALVAIQSMPGSEGFNDLARSLCHQASLALDRVMLAGELAAAKLTSETEQLRSALLSSVSHDLRTPLASIIGSTSSLHDYGDAFSPHDRHELLATVLAEARRLDRYIQNLLDMTRIGQGAISLHRDWVDIRDLIASATARLQTAGEAPPPFDVHVDDEVPMLWVHGVLIEQALVNLLDNAARFSPPGGQVAIDAHRVEEHLEITVCDQGPGIPVEEQDKVFDMFYTVRQGDRVGQPGTGLGLAICRGLIGAHGGSVTAHTGHAGRGTCMVVRLPLLTPHTGAAT